MNLTAEFALIAPIVVPLLVLLPLYLARNKPDLRESISLTGGFLNFFFVLYLFGAFGCPESPSGFESMRSAASCS